MHHRAERDYPARGRGASRGLIAALMLVVIACAPARAQTGGELMARWLSAHESALAGVQRVVVRETGRYSMEGSAGTRRIELTAELKLERGSVPVGREVSDLSVDGRPVDMAVSERGRRYATPLRGEMQRAADLLLAPGAVLEGMTISDSVERDTFSTTPVMGVQSRASAENASIPRATWWFDEETGALRSVRAFVSGPDGAALDVVVRFERVDGLDLPVRRWIEGSMSMRRRVRTFTILVDSRSEFVDHVIERSPRGRD